MTDIDEAIDRALKHKAKGEAIAIGVLCNAVHLLERLLERKIIPDTLTDQTSAHDPLIGYWPHDDYHMSRQRYYAKKIPKQYIDYAYDTMYKHVELMLQLQKKGAITFDYGNNIRARAEENQNRICDKSHLIFPDLFLHISVHYSAKERAHSVGQH